MLSAVLVLAVLSIVLLRGDVIRRGLVEGWPDLLVWVALAIILNFFPVVLGDLRITLDMPILLAVAILFPAPLAAVAGWLAAFDKREIQGGISFSKALFNRSQICLSVFLASSVFHALVPNLQDWPRAALGTIAAVAIDVTTNLALVALFLLLRSGGGWAAARRAFAFQHVPIVFGVHLGYGVLALVLARLFADVGEWSVVAFLVPFLAAQQLLVRNQRLVSLTAKLRSHERLLARALDRTIDERRDERRSIAAELHDDALQSLIRISMLAQLLRREVPRQSVAADDVEELVKLSQSSIDSLRDVMSELQKSPLGPGGVIPRLRAVVQDLKLESGIRIELFGEMERPIGPDTQVVIYQVAREALINAVKHAHATSICIRLQDSPDEVRLLVEDDGVGFERQAVNASRHFGIGIMEERVWRVGGAISVEDRNGAGTRVTASFPRGLASTATRATEEN